MAIANLVMHCKSCGCSPIFFSTDIVYKHVQQISREVVEVYPIVKEKEKCISQAAFDLCDKECVFLQCVFS